LWDPNDDHSAYPTVARAVEQFDEPQAKFGAIEVWKNGEGASIESWGDGRWADKAAEWKWKEARKVGPRAGPSHSSRAIAGRSWQMYRATLVPLPVIRDRKSYAASAMGFASSTWHLAMTFVTDFEVHLNG
jgi:hypothetical protein